MKLKDLLLEKHPGGAFDPKKHLKDPKGYYQLKDSAAKGMIQLFQNKILKSSFVKDVTANDDAVNIRYVITGIKRAVNDLEQALYDKRNYPAEGGMKRDRDGKIIDY